MRRPAHEASTFRRASRRFTAAANQHGRKSPLQNTNLEVIWRNSKQSSSSSLLAQGLVLFSSCCSQCFPPLSEQERKIMFGVGNIHKPHGQRFDSQVLLCTTSQLNVRHSSRSPKPRLHGRKPEPVYPLVVWAAAKSCRTSPAKYGSNILTTGGALDFFQLKPKQALKHPIIQLRHSWQHLCPSAT